MRQMTAPAIGLIISVAAAVPAALSQQTLPEQVKQYGEQYGDLRLSSAPTFPDMDLRELISKSDLIVRGKVISEQVHLSRDERSIETDFGLQPLAVLQQRHAGRATPGSEPRLVVSVFGGEIVLDGHKVIGDDPSLRRFEVGSEYVLFLTERPTLNAYILTGHSNGAFEVEGDTVVPRRERDGCGREPFGLFMKRLQELIMREK